MFNIPKHLRFNIDSDPDNEDGPIDPDYVFIRPEDVNDIYEYFKKSRIIMYPADGSHEVWMTPKLIVLFEDGSINNVADIVADNLVHPLGKGRVASIIVQESMLEPLIEQIKIRMRPMDKRVVAHPNFIKSLNLIERLRPKTICMEEFDESDVKKNDGHMIPGSPIIVCDFPQFYFGKKPTGIITLNSFRHFNELIKLANREDVPFTMVSVWTEKTAHVYELASRFRKATYFLLNSIKAPLKPIMPFIKRDENTVLTADNFHYETITTLGKQNKRQFLLPWILFMLCDLLIECGHLLHLTVSKRVVFDPIVGFIFTIDFFILCLNLYCLLCVISQYQEYRDQRAEEALPVSPIVIVTAPQKTKKSQTLKAPEGKTRQTRRLLAASPLITSQRLTNFSTITEEEEQQIKCKKIAASSGAAALSDTTEVRVGVGANAEKEGHGINGSCEQLSENPSPQEPDEGVNAGIPIIISEPSSLP
ncbi:uncharacterized protein LOC115622362 [Scaptodrosophila lebanonensis]|uniref:Uncharacterized protein LOC115622362 n=1 Tax=Drosophila lebanonensis TaxID=7225 RepID=A0A6J2TB05_DROLE|nr:uncharacterized protein LOC115622362 [Scaptodrosophila lebanonensis]